MERYSVRWGSRWRRSALALSSGALTLSLLLAPGAQAARSQPEQSLASLRTQLRLADHLAEHHAKHNAKRYRRIDRLAVQLERQLGDPNAACRAALGAAERLPGDRSRRGKLLADLRRASGGLARCTPPTPEPEPTLPVAPAQHPPETPKEPPAPENPPKSEPAPIPPAKAGITPPRAIVEAYESDEYLQAEGHAGEPPASALEGKGWNRVDQEQTSAGGSPGPVATCEETTCDLPLEAFAVKVAESGETSAHDEEASCTGTLWPSAPEPYEWLSESAIVGHLLLDYDEDGVLISASLDYSHGFAVSDRDGCASFHGDETVNTTTPEPIDVAALDRGAVLTIPLSAEGSMPANKGSAELSYEWSFSLSFRLVPA